MLLFFYYTSTEISLICFKNRQVGLTCLVCLKLRHKRRAEHMFLCGGRCHLRSERNLTPKAKTIIFSMQCKILIDSFIRILSLLVDQNKNHF